MKKWSKVLSAGALALVAGVSLTACGNNSSQENKGSSSVDKITIWADKQDIEFLKKMDGAIKATGVKEVVVKEVPMLQQIKDYDKTSAEDEPDIITIPHDNIGDLADLGYIKPTTATINDKVESEAVKGNLKYKNENYGAVKTMETLVMFYDKAAFPTKPTSLTEFTKGDKKLTANYSDAFTGWMFSSGNGAQIFDDAQSPKKVKINTSEAADGLKFMKKLTDTRGKELTDDNALADFTAKRAQAFLTGPWNADKVGDVGIMAIPAMENGKAPKPFLNTKSWQMTKKGDKNKAAIEKVLTALVTEEAAKNRLETSKEVLPVKGVDFSQNELANAMAEQAKNTVQNPNVPQIKGFWDPVANASKKVLYNGADAKAALDEAAQTFATEQKLEVA